MGGKNRKTGVLAEQKGDRSYKEIKRTISKKAKQKKDDDTTEESMWVKAVKSWNTIIPHIVSALE